MTLDKIQNLLKIMTVQYNNYSIRLGAVLRALKRAGDMLCRFVTRSMRTASQREAES